MSESSNDPIRSAAIEAHRKAWEAASAEVSERTNQPTIGFMTNHLGQAGARQFWDDSPLTGNVTINSPDQVIVHKPLPLNDGQRIIAVIADTATSVRPSKAVDVAESVLRKTLSHHFQNDTVYLAYADFPELQVSKTPEGFSVLVNFVTGRASELSVPMSGLLYLHPTGFVYIRPDYTTYAVRYTAEDIRTKTGTIPPVMVGTVGIWIMPDEDTITSLMEPETPADTKVTDRCGCGPDALPSVDPEVPESYQLIAAVLSVFVRKAQTDQGIRNLLLAAADEAQADLDPADQQTR